MNLVLPIPDDLAARLGSAGPALHRQVLEGFAADSFRTGRLTRPELRRLLGFETRAEVDGFLKEHGINDGLTPEEFRREGEDLDRLGLQDVRVAVADTGPLHYLVLVGEIEALPALVGVVVIPPEVRTELDRPRTPSPVRAWIAAPPPWLSIRSAPADPDGGLAHLDPGERAAIALATTNGADALLTNDRAGAAAARARGLLAFGTLGVLQRGARRGLLDLPAALARLVTTNFRVRMDLLDALLAEDRVRLGEPPP